MGDVGNPTFYQWEYEGAEKSPDPADNLQVCKTGATLKHDVHGLCTLLDGTDAAEGSFKIKLTEDGRVCETTRGHVQLMEDAGTERLVEDNGCGDGNNSKLAADPSPGNDANNDKDGEGDGTDEKGDNADLNKKDENGSSGNENDKPDGNYDGTGKKEEELLKAQVLFDKVIASVAAQADEFGLDLSDGKAELLFWRNLVLIDTPAVLSLPVDKDLEASPKMRVGQIVRERGTGNILVVCKILKPLLGYLVYPETGVVVDELGEKQTMELAKGSRMLGGNTGCFSGERNCILICTACKRFGISVWVAAPASQLDATFELKPKPEDVNTAQFGFKNESETQAHVAQAVAQWVENFQKPIPPEEIHGGGLGIDEAILKSTMNLYAQFKRRRAKPYLTKSETDELEAAKLEEQKRRDLELERKRREGGARGRGGVGGRGGAGGKGSAGGRGGAGSAGNGAGGGRGGGRGNAKRGRAVDLIDLSDGERGEEVEEEEEEERGGGRRGGLRARAQAAAPAAASANAVAAARTAAGAMAAKDKAPVEKPTEKNVRAGGAGEQLAPLTDAGSQSAVGPEELLRSQALAQELAAQELASVCAAQPSKSVSFAKMPVMTGTTPTGIENVMPNVMPNVMSPEQYSQLLQQHMHAIQQGLQHATSAANTQHQPHASCARAPMQESHATHGVSHGHMPMHTCVQQPNAVPPTAGQQQFVHNGYACVPNGMVDGAYGMAGGAFTPHGAVFNQSGSLHLSGGVGVGQAVRAPAAGPSLAAITARIRWNKMKEAEMIDAQAEHEYFQELFGVQP